MLSGMRIQIVYILLFVVVNLSFAQSVPGIVIEQIEADRPELKYEVGNSFFLVHYDDEQQLPYAESLLEFADTAYARICTARGWAVPLSDNERGGDDRYDIYIQEISDAYGVTHGEIIDDLDENCPSYIEIMPGLSNSDLKIVVAHEFTHACQLSYSYKDGYGQPNGFWFYENTAVWMADDIYDWQLNYYQRYFTIGQDPLHYPYYSIDYFPTGTYLAYGGFIWVKFLTEWQNNDLIIKQIWTRMGQNEGQHIFDDLDYVLSTNYNTSFMEALRIYAEWRYFTGERDDDNHFEHAANYPTSVVLRTHSSYPANNQNFDIQGPGGTSFIRFTGGNDVTRISINGDDNQTWAGSVLEVRDITEIGICVKNKAFNINEDGEGSVDAIGRDTYELIFAPVCVSDKKTPNNEIYSAEIPNMKAVLFENKYSDNNIGDELLLDGTITVNSGDFVALQNNSSHTIKTKIERKNWGTELVKHNIWKSNREHYLLVKNFTVLSYDYDQIARFSPLSGTTVRNVIDGLSFSNNVALQFNDPWYLKNAQGDQSGMNDFLTVSSPFYPTGAYDQTTGGVFLDQGYNPNTQVWTSPYYSVRAPIFQDIQLTQTGKTHRFYFQNWSATNAQLGQVGSNPTGFDQKGVVFTNDNAEVSANFKGTQLTNQETGMQNPSQRKFVRTTDGTLHFVYESMNRIWYEISTDNGATWRIMNSATPLETVDSKLPSIDCYGNSVAIVYQKKNGNYYDIVLKSFVANGDDYSGDVTTTVVTEAQELYTTDANPAIALGYNGKGMIVWEKKIYNPFYSTYKGLKVKAFSLGSGSYTDYYTTYLQTTNEYSVTPAIVTIKEDNGTNYYCIAWSQQEPANNTSEIMYNELYLNVNNEVIHRYTPNPQTPSGGCGYTRNYQPVVTNLVQTGVQNAKLSWMGERVIAGGEFEKVKSGEKKGMDKTNVVFDRKAMFKSKDGANWYYYTWGFGNSPVSTSNNSTLDGNYVVGWCENSGQYNKYVRCTTLSQIKDFGIGGKYLQINNGAGFSSLYGKTEKGTDVSGFYYFTQSDNVGSIGKEGANRIYTGREGVIYKGDTEFYFRIGDITVDDETVEFEEIEEGTEINSNSVLNQFLTTKPFMVSSMSDLYYGVQYGVKNGEEAGNSMTGGSFVKFRVELTDGISGEVIGVFDEVNYSLGNLGQYNKIGYKVNTEGIGERTIKIRLVTEDNIGGLYSVTTNYSDLEEFSKASYQEISYRGSLAVKDYALNQNYPNPFNPETVISYQLVAGGQVSLKVYDILGKEIVTLVDKKQESGRYQVTFDASKLASGVYICRIVTGDFVKTIKMSLVK